MSDVLDADHWKAQYEEMKVDFDEYVASCKEFQSDLEEELTQSQAEAERMGKSIGKIQESLKETEEKNAKQTEELSLAADKLQQWVAQEVKWRRTKRQLEMQKDDLERGFRIAQAENEDQTERLEAAIESQVFLNMQLEDIQRDYKNQKEELLELKGGSATLLSDEDIANGVERQTKHSFHATEREQLMARISAQNEHIAELRNDVDLTTEQYTLATKTLKQLKAAKEEALASVSALQNSITALQAKNSTLQASMAASAAAQSAADGAASTVTADAENSDTQIFLKLRQQLKEQTRLLGEQQERVVQLSEAQAVSEKRHALQEAAWLLEKATLQSQLLSRDKSIAVLRLQLKSTNQGRMSPGLFAQLIQQSDEDAVWDILSNPDLLASPIATPEKLPGTNTSDADSVDLWSPLFARHAGPTLKPVITRGRSLSSPSAPRKEQCNPDSGRRAKYRSRPRSNTIVPPRRSSVNSETMLEGVEMTSPDAWSTGIRTLRRDCSSPDDSHTTPRRRRLSGRIGDSIAALTGAHKRTASRRPSGCDEDVNPHIARPPNPDGLPTMEGYLSKRARGLPTWKKWFFLLDPNTRTLEYYVVQHDARRTRVGGIQLENANISLFVESAQHKAFSFGISPSLSKRTYILAASSQSERDRWISAITPYVASRRPTTIRAKDTASLREGVLSVLLPFSSPRHSLSSVSAASSSSRSLIRRRASHRRLRSKRDLNPAVSTLTHTNQTDIPDPASRTPSASNLRDPSPDAGSWSLPPSASPSHALKTWLSAPVEPLTRGEPMIKRAPIGRARANTDSSPPRPHRRVGSRSHRPRASSLTPTSEAGVELTLAATAPPLLHDGSGVSLVSPSSQRLNGISPAPKLHRGGATRELFRAPSNALASALSLLSSSSTSSGAPGGLAPATPNSLDASVMSRLEESIRTRSFKSHYVSLTQNSVRLYSQKKVRRVC